MKTERKVDLEEESHLSIAICWCSHKQEQQDYKPFQKATEAQSRILQLLNKAVGICTCMCIELFKQNPVKVTMSWKS